VCAWSAHNILRMGGESIRTRRLDRNDGAARRVAPGKGLDPNLLNESCRSVFPSGVRDEYDPHDGREHTPRASASDGIHSAQQCGPAGLVCSFRPNAPLHRFAKDSRMRFALGTFPRIELPLEAPDHTSRLDRRSETGMKPNRNASRNCWMIQPLVGCFVTLTCRMCRRSWLMTKNQ
jgi:hypothetical protein